MLMIICVDKCRLFDVTWGYHDVHVDAQKMQITQKCVIEVMN